jgi:hypothetical protein
MPIPDDCPHCRGTGVVIEIHHVCRPHAETYLCGVAATPGTVFVALEPGLDGAITATRALADYYPCRGCAANLERALERAKRDAEAMTAKLEARELRRAERASAPKSARKPKASANPLAAIGAMDDAAAPVDPRQAAVDARLAGKAHAKPVARVKARGGGSKRGKSKPAKRPRGPGGVVLNRRRGGRR